MSAYLILMYMGSHHSPSPSQVYHRIHGQLEKERREKEAREKEMREKEMREKEAREKETREKNTPYDYRKDLHFLFI